jgi:glycine/D-amino acid oxidase-like deaminating enzyme
VLTENTYADVCVIGAGIAGMLTAYMLTRAGKSVIVLDDGPMLAVKQQEQQHTYGMC